MGQILIIDDDPLICETLADAVQEQGHQATCALTLRKGLKEARSRPYDVVRFWGEGLHKPGRRASFCRRECLV